MANKTQNLMRDMAKQAQKETRVPIAKDMYLPNHSGKHDAALYSFTDGSVIFSESQQLTEDNGNLFWDNTNNRLGILNTSPQSPFHVIRGGTAGTPSIGSSNVGAFQNSTATSTGAAISIISGATGLATLNFGDTADENEGRVSYDNNTDDMLFWTQAGQRAVLTSEGYWGIGTDDPKTTLHTVISGTPGTPVIDSKTVAVFQRNAGASNEAGISVISGNTGSSNVYFGDIQNERIGRIRFTHSDNSFNFWTNSTTSMLKIDASGGVICEGTDRPLTLPNLAVDPDVPVDGDMWYNTTSNTYKGVENGSVVTFTTS